MNLPIFPGYEQIDIIRFPIFPGFWSANLIFGINFVIRFRLEINLIMTPRNYYNYPRNKGFRYNAGSTHDIVLMLTLGEVRYGSKHAGISCSL